MDFLLEIHDTCYPTDSYCEVCEIISDLQDTYHDGAIHADLELLELLRLSFSTRSLDRVLPMVRKVLLEVEGFTEQVVEPLTRDGALLLAGDLPNISFPGGDLVEIVEMEILFDLFGLGLVGEHGVNR